MNKGIDFIIMPKGYGRASKEVRDYIVNLRQENKRLEENNKAMQEEMARVWEKCDDYKSRVEKAIELYQNCEEEDWFTLPIDIINILQNGSDNE